MKRSPKLLSVTMNISTAVRRRASASRPLLGGATVLLFLAGMLVAPLCSALILCAMPCCQHSAPATHEATNDIPCPTDCTISDLEGQNTPMTATPSPMPVATAPVTTGVAASSMTPVPSALSGHGTGLAEPSHRALHLVYSVFLI